ncbi:MAG: thymidine phosphorylase [Paracoccaceae bacterium]
MQPSELISLVKEGGTPSTAALDSFCTGLADFSVSDAQGAAFAMAVCLKGLNVRGRKDLTLAMRNSGKTLSWDLNGPVLDKHSTGGLGDCVSLILAPLLAASGVYVPMISGRGLGHTGGTLDKMEAIPGVSVNIEVDKFKNIVSEIGCAIISANNDIAPADRRLYGIRDVTATVESLDLITASILSKKLAAGLDGLVLDVKCGSGAFMTNLKDAEALANTLVETGNQAGCKTSAIITDMSQPLAPSMGNAVEVREALKVLSGQANKSKLAEVSIKLASFLTKQQGIGRKQVEKKFEDLIANGSALEVFGRMVSSLGGPIKFTDDWNRFLPEATVITEIPTLKPGYLNAWHGRDLGNTIVTLGGGRRVQTDLVDPSVGLDQIQPLGSYLNEGDIIARVHASRTDIAREVIKKVQAAAIISSKKKDLNSLFFKEII